MQINVFLLTKKQIQISNRAKQILAARRHVRRAAHGAVLPGFVSPGLKFEFVFLLVKKHLSA